MKNTTLDVNFRVHFRTDNAGLRSRHVILNALLTRLLVALKKKNHLIAYLVPGTLPGTVPRTGTTDDDSFFVQNINTRARLSHNNRSPDRLTRSGSVRRVRSLRHNQI